MSKLPLADVGDVAEALARQSAATTEFATDIVGYTLVGTNPGVRRTLGLEKPIFGTIAQGSRENRDVKLGLLRKKLISCGVEAPAMQSLRGVGYRLCSSIRPSSE